MSEKLQIDLNTACDTLKVTTQHGIWKSVHPIIWRYHTDTMALKVHRLKTTVFTDTGFINQKSLTGNVCYQGYSAELFIRIISIKNTKDAADSLITFAHDVGAQAELVSDHPAELIGPKSKFAKKARFLNVKQSSCEPYTQRQNEFEGEIRLLKRPWKNQLTKNNCPFRF